MKKIAVILALSALFLLGLSAQNTKPFALPDTLTLSINDSGSINLLLNDYDQQGDQMKITKFDRFSFITFKTLKNDTGIFTITKYGLLSVRAKKAGVFTYKYIVQDGKAGAGRVGYFTLICKNSVKPNEWMDVGCSGALIHMDSALNITIYKGSCVYKGKINKWETGCSIQGYEYQQWHGDSLITIVQQWVLYLPIEVYEWAK